MNKRTLIITGLLALSMGLSSCSRLQSPHYVGEIESIDESDLPSETIWMQGDDVYFVKRIDSNTVVAATMDWDAKANEFTIRSFPLILSALGGHMFLNVKDGDLYTILRVACGDDESILLFTIDTDKIKEDIANEKVNAHEDNGNIVMDCSKEEQDAYILENFNSMFAMCSASVARKISRDKENKNK